MSFNWFDLIVVFGILQGLVCALLLFGQKPAVLNKKLVILVLLVFSLLSFKIELHTIRLWDFTAFRYFPLAIDLLIQPLLYLYVCSLTQPAFRLNKRMWLHFLPVFLFMIHAIIVYLVIIQVDSLTTKDIIAENWHFNAVKTFEDYLSVFSICLYGTLSLRAINLYRKWLFQNISDANYLNLKWLKNLVVITGILGAALCLNIVLDQWMSFNHRFFHWQIFYIYLSVVIYYIGMKAYAMPNQYLQQSQYLMATQEIILVPAKYNIEELNHAEFTITDALVNKRMYLDNELTLQSLSLAINLSPALVSVTINQKLDKSFRTMINDLRVEEVKLRLIDSNFSHLSILGIALECGFNSEASFYRIFKSATGISPKAYIIKEQRRFY